MPSASQHGLAGATFLLRLLANVVSTPWTVIATQPLRLLLLLHSSSVQRSTANLAQVLLVEQATSANTTH